MGEETEDSASQWQVTCQCGWRTKGSRQEVVSAVQQHGRETHEQDLTEQDVMDIAVELSA